MTFLALETGSGGIGAVLLLILTIVGFILVVYLTLSYAAVYMILMSEPEISGMEALKKSREMMKGNKCRLVLFNLSFIGWFIISAFGLPALYVMPYYITSRVLFMKQIYKEAGYTNAGMTDIAMRFEGVQLPIAVKGVASDIRKRNEDLKDEIAEGVVESAIGNIQPGSEGKEAESVEPEYKVLKCRKCGAVLPNGAKFCGKCGTMQ